MDLTIEYVPIDTIQEYAGNVKKHPKKQVEQIAKSIQEFGFNDPLAISNGIIVEGHGRLLAARSLGMDKVPVIRLDGLTDEQRRAYTLIHNQLNTSTGYDLKQLAIELENIKSIDMPSFDLDLPKIQVKVDKLEMDEANSYFGDARESTYKSTNFDRYDDTRTDGFYQMPIIRACDFVPDMISETQLQDRIRIISITSTARFFLIPKSKRQLLDFMNLRPHNLKRNPAVLIHTLLVEVLLDSIDSSQELQLIRQLTHVLTLTTS